MWWQMIVCKQGKMLYKEGFSTFEAAFMRRFSLGHKLGKKFYDEDYEVIIKEKEKKK